MHLYLIDSKKVAIFWSPRCGYKSLDRLMTSWGYPPVAETTHMYVGMDSLPDDYTQFLLCRDPWARLKSALRMPWYPGYCKDHGHGHGHPKEWLIDLDFESDSCDLVDSRNHHFAPQCSQAVRLMDYDRVIAYDVSNADSYFRHIAEVMGEDARMVDELHPDSLSKHHYVLPRVAETWFLDKFRCDYEMLEKIKIR